MSGGRGRREGAYASLTRRRVAALTGLATLLTLLTITSLSVGTASLTFASAARLLAHLILPVGAPPVPQDLMRIVVELRLPRVLMGVVTGACFGVAGTLLQSALRNPLASPYTVGVSASAAFGAALAIILGAGVVGWFGEYFIYTNPYAVVANAFVFSVLCAAMVSALALIKGATPGVTILAGISMTYLFSAATSLLQYFGTSQQIAALVFWMFGDLGKAGWLDVEATVAVFAACFTVAMLMSMNYNALMLEDDVAHSLGVNVKRVRAATLAMASLLTATPVAFVGVIGFIGLLAPHIARFLVGADHRYLIPASALTGASLLLGADTLARTVLSPLILPVGVLTAFMGVPLFLHLLLRRGARFW